MLSLSRKRMQSILVGLDLLEVLHITSSAVHVEIQSSNGTFDTIRLIEGDSLCLGDGEILVHSISKSSVHLGFDYPNHISIMRTELMNKSPERKFIQTKNVVQLPQVIKIDSSSTVNDKNRKLEVLKLLAKFSPDDLSSTLEGIANDIKNIA
jgi:sRNA-binding carbon storage regulator CsrA